MTDTEMIGGQEPSKHNVASPVAAAPQVVADERSAQRARGHAKVMAMPDSDMGNLIGPPMKCELPPDGWYCTRMPGHEGPCAALAAAPVQAQEPFAYMIVDESGEAYFGEFCVASGKTDLEAELEGLNYGQDGKPYKIVPVFRAPVQPVAVPDGAGRGYSLGRSIIHECPALVLPQSFIQKLGGAAQIIPLRGMSDEAARQLVSDCNSATPAAQGDAKEETAKVIEWLIAQGHMDWRSDGADECGHEDGFNSNDEEASTLRHCIGLAHAAIAAKAAS